MEACPHCNTACLEPHPELMWWQKCPVCGFCKKKNLILPKDKELAEKDPLCPVIQDAWKRAFKN